MTTLDSLLWPRNRELSWVDLVLQFFISSSHTNRLIVVGRVQRWVTIRTKWTMIRRQSKEPNHLSIVLYFFYFFFPLFLLFCCHFSLCNVFSQPISAHQFVCNLSILWISLSTCDHFSPSCQMCMLFTPIIFVICFGKLKLPVVSSSSLISLYKVEYLSQQFSEFNNESVCVVRRAPGILLVLITELHFFLHTASRKSGSSLFPPLCPMNEHCDLPFPSLYSCLHEFSWLRMRCMEKRRLRQLRLYDYCCSATTTTTLYDGEACVIVWCSSLYFCIHKCEVSHLRMYPKIMFIFFRAQIYIYTE